MGDRVTESFKPYEPSEEGTYGYEYEYDDRPSGGRILWGRVAVLGAALLLAFFLGRWLAPDGTDSEQVADLQAQVQELEEANADLEAELDEQATTETTVPTATASPGETTTGTAATYTVQRGDTLRLIAQDLCGDPEAADQIMELNGITDPTQLSVGDTLTLPEECS
jgi:hypothetical protein